MISLLSPNSIQLKKKNGWPSMQVAFGYSNHANMDCTASVRKHVSKTLNDSEFQPDSRKTWIIRATRTLRVGLSCRKLLKAWLTTPFLSMFYSLWQMSLDYVLVECNRLSLFNQTNWNQYTEILLSSKIDCLIVMGNPSKFSISVILNNTRGWKRTCSASIRAEGRGFIRLNISSSATPDDIFLFSDYFLQPDVK